MPRPAGVDRHAGGGEDGALMQTQTEVKAPATPKVDWAAVPEVDRSRLETGLYKFSGTDENRSQERISQRELGMVEMSFCLPGTRQWIPVKLWDFTSISFGVILQAERSAWPDPVVLGSAPSAGEPAPPSALKLSAGEEVELRIRVTHHQTFRIWCEVKNVSPVKDGYKIGLRRMDVNFPQAVDFERRESFRLPLAPSLALNARVKHPFIYGYWCPMAVSDANKNMGLSLLSRDSSILLFEGMELQVHFELAGYRNTPMTARVTWVHATESNQVRFGVTCLDMTWKLHNGICAFLLFSRQWTPALLRQAGFRAQHVKSRLRFRSVKTMNDYAEVLHLRRDAYVNAGKKPEGTKAEHMAGALDGMSRILMAHHDDRIVGSMTFTFPNSEDVVLDSQAGFSGKRFPVALPPKTNLIEVSRLCIHDEYRSTDLLQGMFEHGVKHFLMSDRHWLLTSAVTELLPTYLRIGFRKLNASYRHPALNNKEHFLILAHRGSFLWGKDINLFVWNALFGDLIENLIGRGLIKTSVPERLIIRGKLLFRSLSKRMLERKSDRSFRKHLQGLRNLIAIERPRGEDGDGMESVSENNA